MERSIVYGLAGCLVLFVSCSKDAPPSAAEPAATQGAEATPEPQPQTAATNPAAAPAEEPVAAVNPAPPIPAPDTPLSDGQLVGILQTINSGEIQEAELAKSKAKDARVKKFAGQMITHHTESQKQAGQLAKSQSATPAESTVASDLKVSSNAALDNLKGANAADFDAVYMTNQVKEHDAALDLLTNRLIPAASDPKVKALLESARGTVEKHLKSANEIQQALLSSSKR